MSINNCYLFFIFSENGNCLHKITTDTNFEPSLQGILQALYFTATDYNCEIKTISSDNGILGYKSYNYKEKNILFALVVPNYFGEEELADIILERTIDYLFNILVIHIGYVDLFNHNSQTDLEKLKKMLENYDYSLKHILKNFRNLSFMLKSEKKFEVSKDILYPIKHYFENFKNILKVDFVCFVVNESVVWASSDWLALEITDRLLFVMISHLYSENDMNEIPIYFAKTLLEDESTGKIPFKLFTTNLTHNAKLLILADMTMNIKRISDNFTFSNFDEFFMSRITNFKNITSLNNNLVDSTVKSILIINSHLKTHKIMIDESFEETFSNFIENTHFSTALFKKNSFDEFYVKDNLHTFYYYKIAALTFLIIYDKNIPFDDINSVKITLKTFKEQFDNKENYDESEVLKTKK